jgi:hypothetical protein
MCPILKIKVHGQSITADADLISDVTYIPVIVGPGLPYPDHVESPLH